MRVFGSPNCRRTVVLIAGYAPSPDLPQTEFTRIYADRRASR